MAMAHSVKVSLCKCWREGDCEIMSNVTPMRARKLAQMWAFPRSRLRPGPLIIKTCVALCAYALEPVVCHGLLANPITPCVLHWNADCR